MGDCNLRFVVSQVVQQCVRVIVSGVGYPVPRGPGEDMYHDHTHV